MHRQTVRHNDSVQGGWLGGGGGGGGGGGRGITREITVSRKPISSLSARNKNKRICKRPRS